MNSIDAPTFKPINVSDDAAHIGAVQAIDDVLQGSNIAVYVAVPDEFEPTEAFFAQNPHSALVWICRHMNRQKLIKLVQRIYDNPAPATESQVEEVEDGSHRHRSPSRILATAPEERDEVEMQGRKRKREPKERTTRQANKALMERMNLALVQSVASEEDWEAAKAPIALTVEQQRYRSFAKRFPGVGVDAVAHMIANAEAVGSREALLDWQAIIVGWRRQHHEAKKQFRRVTVARTTLAAQAFGMDETHPHLIASQLILSQQEGRDEVDKMGLTVLQRETFRYRLVDAQKSRIESFAEEMRQRWKLDILYEDYATLEQKIRAMARGTGARGVGYGSVAKDYLFEVACQSDDGYVPNKRDNPDLYKLFGGLLDWGKKWNTVKKRFGTVGVFGLLPKSIGANVWFERVTQARVAQWTEMLAECNQDVIAMAHRIEPLFMAFIEERPLPEEFFFLEQVDQYQSGRLLSLFESSQNTPPVTMRVKEVATRGDESSEGEDYGPTQPSSI